MQIYDAIIIQRLWISIRSSFDACEYKRHTIIYKWNEFTLFLIIYLL